VSVIEYLQKVMGLIDGKWITQPVIEDQELGPGQGSEKSGIGTVDVGNGEVIKEAGNPVVTDGKTQATGGPG